MYRYLKLSNSYCWYIEMQLAFFYIDLISSHPAINAIVFSNNLSVDIMVSYVVISPMNNISFVSSWAIFKLITAGGAG